MYILLRAAVNVWVKSHHLGKQIKVENYEMFVARTITETVSP